MFRKLSVCALALASSQSVAADPTAPEAETCRAVAEVLFADAEIAATELTEQKAAAQLTSATDEQIKAEAAAAIRRIDLAKRVFDRVGAAPAASDAVYIDVSTQWAPARIEKTAELCGQ